MWNVNTVTGSIDPAKCLTSCAMTIYDSWPDRMRVNHRLLRRRFFAHLRRGSERWIWRAFSLMASRHIAASTKRPKTDKKGRGAGYMMVDSKSKYAVCRIWGRWTVLLVKLLTDHVSGHSLVDSVFSIALNDTQKISSSNFAPSCQSLG